MQEFCGVAVGITHQRQQDMLRPDILREEIAGLFRSDLKREVRARGQVFRQDKMLSRLPVQSCHISGSSLLPASLFRNGHLVALCVSDKFTLRSDQLTDQRPESLPVHPEIAQHDSGRAFRLHGKAQQQMFCPDHGASRFLRGLLRTQYGAPCGRCIWACLFHNYILVSLIC